MEICAQTLIQHMKACGYVVFERDFDLNIVGLRKLPGTPNVFDDRLCVFFRRDGVWQFRSWPITTDPGTYYLQNPMNVKGTAIVRPGQWRRSHKIGKHGSYEAMVQVGTLGIWRDANKNTEADYGTNPLDENWIGINIHKAGNDSTSVDKWSAGCQVFKRADDFEEFMALIHKQIAAGIGDTISYTLLEWPAANMPAVSAS